MPTLTVYRGDGRSPAELKACDPKGILPRLKTKPGENIAILKILSGYNDKSSQKDAMGKNMASLSHLVREKFRGYISDPSQKIPKEKSASEKYKKKFLSNSYAKTASKKGVKNDKKLGFKKTPEWVNEFSVGKGLAALGAGIIQAGTGNRYTFHISTAKDSHCNGYSSAAFIYKIVIQNMNRLEYSAPVIGVSKLRLRPNNNKARPFLWLSGSNIHNSSIIAFEATMQGSNLLEYSFLTPIPLGFIEGYTDKKEGRTGKGRTDYKYLNLNDYKATTKDKEKIKKRYRKPGKVKVPDIFKNRQTKRD